MVVDDNNAFQTSPSQRINRFRRHLEGQIVADLFVDSRLRKKEILRCAQDDRRRTLEMKRRMPDQVRHDDKNLVDINLLADAKTVAAEVVHSHEFLYAHAVAAGDVAEGIAAAHDMAGPGTG